MMDKLKMAEAPARAGIEREQAVREEVLAFAASAPEIRRGGSRRHVYDSAGPIDRHSGPAVRAADLRVLICFFRPCIITKLTWLRNRAKRPRKFPRADVERLH